LYRAFEGIFQEIFVRSTDEREAFLSILPAAAFDRTLASIVVVISIVFFCAALPFAKVHLPAVPAFIASYQSALAANDVITAILIYGQFSTLRSRALLLLASGYLFTAITAIIHALTFPDLFATAGLFGSGSQTTVWLYMCWHGGFPALVLGYALLKDVDGGPKVRGPARNAIIGSIVAVFVAVCVILWLVTAGHQFLPALLHEGRYTQTMIGVVSSVWLLSLAALVVLWWRRPHSVLDVWLMVVMWAWLLDVALSAVLNEARFDLGFYLGRVYGLAAASFVLAVLLLETGALQAQLSRLLETVRQQAASERDRHQEREQFFSAVVESSNDAIVTKTLEGIITGWNAAAERLFGYTAHEAIGKSIDLIVPDERRAAQHELIQQIKLGRAVGTHETVRIAKDGSKILLSLSVSPIKSRDGKIVGATKIARDLGEIRKAQAALQQETEERERIFETSQDLILVTDSRGSYVQVSPSSASILGYRPDEMVGRSAVEFIYSDDLENTRNNMRLARSGRVLRNFVTRYVHKDGKVVVLTWTGTWSEPVRRHFFIGRDMTEIQQAQEALLESEQMARGIIETALDAFVQMDEAGVIIDWNSQAEKIFGWSRAETIGRVLAELIVPEIHRAHHREGLQRFLETGDGPILGSRFEIESQRRDGTEVKVELSVTALQRRGGHVFNGFIRDLTDKIAAENQVRQAQKMEAVGQLTGGVAHDFNNILTVITGTIEILAEGVADRPDLAGIAKMIDEAAERGADLTRHLLAFARRQPLQPREIDVNTLILTASKLLRPTLGEQIEIETLLAEDPWLAFVDPNQLTTAILNLALNARDAMPNGGKLMIETINSHLDESYASQHSEVIPGEYVLVAISDTGAGIPANLLDKVFEPFFTTKDVGKGTGLGLSMVYGFVKQSEGHIKVYSEEGHGTTIKLYLPRSRELALRQVKVASPEKALGGDELILVVEDDVLVRNYVITQVRSLGYRTLAAANADEALRAIVEDPTIDLLFTDVIMPGAMNGRQLVDEIRKLRGEFKVLYTSGYTENAIVHHGRLDAGVLLLAKPYRKADLARMIRLALKGANTPG
jgi:PAS domain S-box-containing protein